MEDTVERNPYDEPLFAAFNELADASASGDRHRISRAETESIRLKGLHKKWHFEHKEPHRTVQLLRPMVNGQLRYQVQCSCGHLTHTGSRQLAEGEQRAHRKYQRAVVYVERQRALQGVRTTW